MKRFIVVALAVVFLFPVMPVFAAGPATITLPAKMMGNVTFPHEMHQKMVKDCKTCHHKGVAAGACTNCHGKSDKAPSMKVMAHKLCKGCHQKKGMGPTKCSGCHKR